MKYFLWGCFVVSLTFLVLFFQNYQNYCSTNASC